MSGTVGGGIAIVEDEFPYGVSDGQDLALVGDEALLQLTDLQVQDVADVVPGQLVEDQYAVDAVEHLGTEDTLGSEFSRLVSVLRGVGHGDGCAQAEGAFGGVGEGPGADVARKEEDGVGEVYGRVVTQG